MSDLAEKSDSGYRHILAAVDFAPESAPVIQRAQMLRDRFGARLSLVTVVEYVPPTTDYASGAFVAEPLLPDDFQLEQQLLEVARQDLDALGERLGVPPGDRIIESGPTGRSIRHVAEDLGVDLVVVGVHDQGWLGQLLGSTSKALLQHEVCDLLAVRLGGSPALA